MSWIALVDYAAVLIFALTGALTASRAQLDPVGFMFLASLTGVGGGTVRDIVLDRDVFWVFAPGYIGVASCAALVVFFTAHLLESRLKVLIWLDSLALAVAVAAGTGVALALGQPASITIIIGSMTGCFGGLMRDVVVNQVPLVLTQGELYITAAFMGAAAGWASTLISDQPFVPLACAAVITWVLRAGSLAFGWRLPTYKSTPPKS
ncbi:MAG: trimeric intracellular cation channel family protein [Aliishimia sp.]